MHCLFNFDQRPPRTAKVSRQLWDALAEAHGEEPKSLGMYVSEGGFKDWMFIIGDDMLEIEAGLVGSNRSGLSDFAGHAKVTVENRSKMNQ